MFAVGIGFATWPFVSYLQPNAKAYAGLPRFELPQLEHNSYLYVAHPFSSSDWPSEILVVKRGDGTLDLWHIPKVQGKYALPDGHWWRPGPSCSDLSPDFSTRSIYCKDPGAPEWTKAYRWGLDGKALTDAAWVPDLERVPGKQELGDVVLYHPDAI